MLIFAKAACDKAVGGNTSREKMHEFHVVEPMKFHEELNTKWTNRLTKGSPSIILSGATCQEAGCKNCISLYELCAWCRRYSCGFAVVLLLILLHQLLFNVSCFSMVGSTIAVILRCLRFELVNEQQQRRQPIYYFHRLTGRDIFHCDCELNVRNIDQVPI